MSRDQEYRARGKKTHKMTRDGLVERDAATGAEQRISQRGQDFNLRQSQPPPDIAPGGSVHQAIHDHATRARSGHPPNQEARAGYEQADEVRPDGYPDEHAPDRYSSAQYHSQEAPAPGAQGASPVSYIHQEEASRPADQPLRREPAPRSASDAPTQHRQGSSYQRRFSENAPLPDAGTHISERLGADVYSAPRGYTASKDYLVSADGERLMETGTTPDSFTMPVDTPVSTRLDSRPGRLRLDDAQPAAPKAKKQQQGTAYQRQFDKNAANPDNMASADTPTERPQPDAGSSVPDKPTQTNHPLPADDALQSSASTPKDTVTDTIPHPKSARSGRFKFDDTQPAASGARNQQHGTAYQRRFAGDDAKPDAGDAADTPTGRAKPDGGTSASEPSSGAKSRKRSKLEFAKDEQPPAPPRDRKLEKAQSKADKTATKLEKARKKLPTRRKVRLQKEFDAETGKPKRRLTFEKEVKTQRQHVKGPLPLRPVKAGAGALILQAHRKVSQVEHENVGVEAAHKGELVLEGALRKGYRLQKTRPYRRVAKLQHQAAKNAVNLSYRQAIHDNPKLQSNIFSRIAQKRKIKRQYAKMARDAKRAARTAKKTAVTTEKIASSVGRFVARHPLLFGIIGLILLLVLVIMGAFSSCSNMATGSLSSVLASSYLANDADIDGAELSYTEWETDLLLEIENAETTHSGYDEYRYNVDDIGHDPHELMAFLTSVYQDFTQAEAEAVLRELFDEQYTLEFVPEIEIRYNDPDDANDDGDYEPYEWHILNVNLTAQSFSDVIAPRINSNQRQIFDLLMTTYGNRQYLMNPFGFNWLPYVSSYYGWRIHPITGARDYHMGLDIAVASGTEILAGHDGVVTSAGTAGAYGLVVVLDDGEGLVSKYAHCSELLVSPGQEVKKGDVIAKVGSTGDSTGPHLHLEIIKDGQYLNPLYFALTGDDGSGGIPPGQPGGPDIPAYPGEPMGDGSYAALMEEAQKHLGKPYVFGAKGPDKFDCSGFVCWSLTQSGVRSISTNAQGLYNACTPVSAADVQPGDLIFFHSTYSTSNTVTHVGIYIGNGQMLHAGKPVQYASFDTNYWREHFYAFGRI